MHLQIDKRKILLYFVFILFLSSSHNFNFTGSLQNYFQIKEIKLLSNFQNNKTIEIKNSLKNLYNLNIFSINLNEVKKILNSFEFIHEYTIKKEYPSVIKIKIKETEILAYYFENNEKFYIGANGKKIKINFNHNENIPLIFGKVEIKKFLSLKEKLIKNGFSLNDFKEIYFFKSKRWDLIYKNKIKIKLPIENIDKSLVQLKEIINNSNINNFEIIDLRISDRIILS